MVEGDVAADLLAEAMAHEQVVRRLDAGYDLELVRMLVRRKARERNVKIRTALLDEHVLVVVLVDAAVWNESAEVMRAKLAPTRAEV